MVIHVVLERNPEIVYKERLELDRVSVLCVLLLFQHLYVIALIFRHHCMLLVCIRIDFGHFY